jgi:hypothetical protein
MRLKDWLKTGAVHALAAIGGSFLYGVMMYMMDTEFDFSTFVEVSVIYLLFFGAFLNLVLILTVQKQNLPLALSFGATRKEAFWGMQCYRIVYAVLIMAAAVMMLLLTEEPYGMAAVLLPIGLAAVLLLGAIGSVGGVMGIRYGKGAAIAAGVMMGIVSMGIGIFVGIWMVKHGPIGGLPEWTLWLFPVIGLVAHIGSMVLEHKTIFKYNVKL